MKVGKKAADKAEDVRDQTKKDAKKVAGSAKFIGSEIKNRTALPQKSKLALNLARPAVVRHGSALPDAMQIINWAGPRFCVFNQGVEGRSPK